MGLLSAVSIKELAGSNFGRLSPELAGSRAGQGRRVVLQEMLSAAPSLHCSSSHPRERFVVASLIPASISPQWP